MSLTDEANRRACLLGLGIEHGKRIKDSEF